MTNKQTRNKRREFAERLDSSDFTMATTEARETCSKVLETLKKSQLNFFLQETPYSAFITIRKKFCKGLNNPPKIDAEIPEEKREDYKNEVILLKNLLKKRELELETSRGDSFILEKRLEKAESDMIKHFEASKVSTSKLGNEISTLDLVNKKTTKLNSVLEADLREAKKSIKSLEKIAYNLEKKNDNLKDTVENLKHSKIELKTEKDELSKKIKTTDKMKSSRPKSVKSISIQTDPDLQGCQEKSSENNNHDPEPNLSDVDAPISSETQPNQSFKCLICSEFLHSVEELKVHSEENHELSIDLGKLKDIIEEDFTSRFVKSVRISKEYLTNRIKFYPDNCDHLEERIKIRMLSKLNFEFRSKKIEENMKTSDFSYTRLDGPNYETEDL